MSLPSKHCSKAQFRSEPPAVATVSKGPGLGVGGRRLVTLGMNWLNVKCACGHEGEVAAAELADRHGSATRVRHAVEKLRCSQCGHARIRNITLAD